MTLPRDASLLWKSLHLVVTAARPAFCRLLCEGREHLPPEGGFVLTCNHTMGPDFLAVGYATPRQVHFMAKAEIFEQRPWVGRLLHAIGTFPVRRGEADLSALEHAIQLVRAGRVLGMFPEGTRSRDGKLGRGRSGAARIAIQAQVPVVPVAVIASGPVFSRQNWLSLRQRALLTVRFGKPLPPPASREDNTALRHYTRQIMQAIADLMPADAGGGRSDITIEGSRA